MEDLLAGLLQNNILGFLACYLVVKGMPTLNKLSISIDKLTEALKALEAKVDNIDKRLDKLEKYIQPNFYAKVN